MIDKLESLDEAIVSSLRERFHHEVNSVLHSEAYVKCRAGNPRKLAKKKMEVVVAQFSAACGDSQEIVRDAFAEILIEKAYSLQNIQRIVNPMLTRT